MYFNAGGLFWGAGHESAGVSELSATWFLAEGSTGDFADTYILVGNPGVQEAQITFTFLIGDPGVPPVVATTTVGAAKRFTLDAESLYFGDARGLSKCALSEIATLGTCTLTPLVVGDPIASRVILTASQVWFITGGTLKFIPK